MATCNVTLDLAYGGDQPYTSGSMLVGRAIPADSTTGYVDGSLEAVPLANPPTVLGAGGFLPLEQTKVYLFVGPDGTRYYKLIPASGTANFSDLVDVVPVVTSPGYLTDDVMTGVLLDTSSSFREELDEIFTEGGGGLIADAGVAALINSGPNTKDALGAEALDDTSPLGGAIVALEGPVQDAGGTPVPGYRYRVIVDPLAPLEVQDIIVEAV